MIEGYAQRPWNHPGSGWGAQGMRVVRTVLLGLSALGGFRPEHAAPVREGRSCPCHVPTLPPARLAHMAWDHHKFLCCSLKYTRSAVKAGPEHEKYVCKWEEKNRNNFLKMEPTLSLQRKREKRAVQTQTKARGESWRHFWVRSFHNSKSTCPQFTRRSGSLPLVLSVPCAPTSGNGRAVCSALQARCCEKSRFLFCSHVRTPNISKQSGDLMADSRCLSPPILILAPLHIPPGIRPPHWISDAVVMTPWVRCPSSSWSAPTDRQKSSV